MERTSLFVDIDGPVHYIDHGGKGTSAVLLHGLEASHLNWDRMAPGLARSHRPYALDLRGFGLTPLANNDASLGSQVELVARLIEEVVGGPAIVFGNSMGGTVAMLLARRHPSLVAGLVLLGPGLPPQSTKAVSLDNVMFLGFPLIPGFGEAAFRFYTKAISPEERAEYLWDSMAAHPDRIDDLTRHAFVEMRRLRDQMEWTPRAYCQALRSITAVLGNRWRFRQTIHRIAAPTLVIHGVMDDTVPFESAEWLVRERPDWRLAPLPDCGHVPHIELPERSLDIFTEWVVSAALAPA